MEDVPKLGRPIGEWDPHALEVHPAGPTVTSNGSVGGPGARVLSRYVRREHDRLLDEAVQEAASGCSRIVVLVGSSSTGKTRACWEAVQPLAAEGWCLWHPFDPTRAEAALEDLHQVGPQTVVWLNEAQHYLGDREHGERIAAALHHLLTSAERGPVLVMGTLWPEYAQQYRAIPTPGEPDPHSRARELLAASTLAVPEFFDVQALAAAAELAKSGDVLLADALTRAGVDGRVAQDLAGAPVLLDRLRYASAPARALLEAAMDARRLGVGLHLPQMFLTDAAVDYLTDLEHDQLPDHWAPLAYDELAVTVHGKQALLRRTHPRHPRRPPTLMTGANSEASKSAGPLFLLADYLEQHGRSTRRRLCPPASFWHAAYTHLTDPSDLNSLTEAANDRHRLQWAAHLRNRAVNHNSTTALDRMEELGEKAGDRQPAETVAWEAARGNAGLAYRVAELRENFGNRKGAEVQGQHADERVNPGAVRRLVEQREGVGDRQGAEALARRAADHGHTDLLRQLALAREEAGEHTEAESMARQAAGYGDTHTLYLLAELRKEAGSRNGAENLARQAASHGNTRALYLLIGLREDDGDREGAEDLARQAVHKGKPGGLYLLAGLREESGDKAGAEALAREAAGLGHNGTLRQLAVMREQAGDKTGAETLALEAADHGHLGALCQLALIREQTGDRKGAEEPARQVANYGSKTALQRLLHALWPNGLDPDGTPTLPWKP
ncbi:AAA family ATPase [Streptomyces hydrogenans]|uniref:AAA family ATPase n=1 Tax=Streptomyces hydrogenans TaxID=1873719 RepID=UPI00380A5A2D